LRSPSGSGRARHPPAPGDAETGFLRQVQGCLQEGELGLVSLPQDRQDGEAIPLVHDLVEGLGRVAHARLLAATPNPIPPSRSAPPAVTTFALSPWLPSPSRYVMFPRS